MEIIDLEKFSGYKRIPLSKKELKKYIGCKIIYITTPHGYCFYDLKFAVLHNVVYNQVIIDDGYDSFDFRDLKDIGVKK